MKAVDNGEDVNEVEGAGNTPLHCAAFEGWLEGCELLLNLGAKLNASNNAGDRPWHWAKNMGHTEVMEFLEKVSFLSLYRRIKHLFCPLAPNFPSQFFPFTVSKYFSQFAGRRFP